MSCAHVPRWPFFLSQRWRQDRHHRVDRLKTKNRRFPIILTPTGPLALVSESRSPGDADVECWIPHGYQNAAQRPATRAGTEGQPDPAVALPAAQAGTAHRLPSVARLTCGAGTHVPALFALLLVRPASAAVPQWHTSTTTRASWLPSSTRRTECQCPASSTRRSQWQFYTSSTRRSASHIGPSSTRRRDYQFSSSTRRAECEHRRPSQHKEVRAAMP